MRPVAAAAALATLFWLAFPSNVRAECQPVDVTANTPTGIAGCERWGIGTASHYGPGEGVAMNFCTWTRRHTAGCGSVRITSLATKRSTTAPVVDFCDCYVRTARERIVDLQWGVLAALGLDQAAGLYRVRVVPADSSTLPDTAMLP